MSDIRQRGQVPSVKKILFKRSRNNMSKLLNTLKQKLKRTPEFEVHKRDKLIRKIELLSIIRYEMNGLMKEL